MPSRDEITAFFRNLQKDIIKQLEAADGKAKFLTDEWERPAGGGGVTRVITNGNIIEKGGVNFSAVEGPMPENISKALNVPRGNFYATGVSIVLHPENPHVPIIHMNVRYFEVEGGIHWFGGGIDLTPHYIVEEDAREFHKVLKDVCDKHDAAYYDKFKAWADEYFYLPHREETRGVGGIFFDRLSADGSKFKGDLFAFVKDVGNAFAPAYTKLMRKYGDQPYTDAQKDWQKYRRGRYVEFNLIFDKGTKFGIQTGGRTESIFISLPPEVKWEYNRQFNPGSAEAYTQSMLKKGINWLK